MLWLLIDLEESPKYNETINKIPNCEKNFFAVFPKTSRSAGHEILKFSRKIILSKITEIDFCRSGIFSGLQQTYPQYS
ncbi:hypothetical protein T4E_1710 [Trichinella pseudospiralis]|uniref:Uncharacterized protein n=1 Tax=Trichinella pseudospiralis TaxID=6337 RepID=A0A0V0XER0_TRIPS|nr:hypothetical protein T4E_1710 [Trichinella pseudospiralis]